MTNSLLSTGIKIMWRSITPYLKQYDPDVNFNLTPHIYNMTFLGQTVSMYMGGILATIVGPRCTDLLGAFMILGGTLMASYATQLEHLLLSQGLVGIAYSAPIACAFKHFTYSRATVTGLITSGTGAGPFIFNLVASSFVKPHNAWPIDTVTGLYRPESTVVARVPAMFRVLAFWFFVVGAAGSLLLSDPSSQGRSTSTKGVSSRKKLPSIQSGQQLKQKDTRGRASIG
jgi:hypothetical protein